MNYERNKVFRKDSSGLVYNMNLRTNLKRDIQRMSRLTFSVKPHIIEKVALFLTKNLVSFSWKRFSFHIVDVECSQKISQKPNL